MYTLELLDEFVSRDLRATNIFSVTVVGNAQIEDTGTLVQLGAEKIVPACHPIAENRIQ
ncbi:hypothetical protein D3C80_2104310 [compost metagenome]